jgi:hypothetical protein
LDVHASMELGSRTAALGAMSDGIEKLRGLAKQARVLSQSVPDRHRSKMLQGLAQLYEDQAQQLEGAVDPFD